MWKRGQGCAFPVEGSSWRNYARPLPGYAVFPLCCDIVGYLARRGPGTLPVPFYYSSILPFCDIFCDA